ncbi:MAG: M15 family metallopeptidase [Opitutaceae bacterium]
MVDPKTSDADITRAQALASLLSYAGTEIEPTTAGTTAITGMMTMHRDYVTHISEMNRVLGIPADYAVSRDLVLQLEAPQSDLHLITADWEIHPVRLYAPAAAAWFRLNAAAAAENIALLPLSGFRSVSRQLEIFRRKLEKGIPMAEILKMNAAPGYSEHHTGRAVDVSTPGERPFAESFGETAAFRWLTQRAGEFGFRLSYPRDNPHGISYEPWHWWWGTGIT